MNYLGIDYGDAKVGVALATGPLAEPLTTVKTEKAIQALSVFDQRADHLRDLAKFVIERKA